MMFPSIFESLRPGVGSDGPWKAQRDVQIHKSKRMISEAPLGMGQWMNLNHFCLSV